MQQLLLQGKAAMTYNGTWLLSQLQAGTPTVPFDLHVAPLPLVDGASTAHSILSWAGFALPAAGCREPRQRVCLPRVREPAGGRPGRRRGPAGVLAHAASNAAIHDAVAREFLPMFDDAITPLNWLWEPEIDAEIGNQVQALVKGDTDPRPAGKAIQAVAEELRSSGRSYYP